mmetsp:Transcript_32602/g.75023  ORF Transcript_32602/g.75023 Transcript_32602/m.75023 type:complete len:342 (-) Transcript_32602:240-1265(-)
MCQPRGRDVSCVSSSVHRRGGVFRKDPVGDLFHSFRFVYHTRGGFLCRRSRGSRGKSNFLLGRTEGGTRLLLGGWALLFWHRYPLHFSFFIRVVNLLANDIIGNGSRKRQPILEQEVKRRKIRIEHHLVRLSRPVLVPVVRRTTHELCLGRIIDVEGLPEPPVLLPVQGIVAAELCELPPRPSEVVPDVVRLGFGVGVVRIGGVGAVGQRSQENFGGTEVRGEVAVDGGRGVASRVFPSAVVAGFIVGEIKVGVEDDVNLLGPRKSFSVASFHGDRASEPVVGGAVAEMILSRKGSSGSHESLVAGVLSFSFVVENGEPSGAGSRRGRGGHGGTVAVGPFP